MDDRLQSELPVGSAYHAKYILANHPNAKIGILYQNDDLGKDYVKGLKDAGRQGGDDDRGGSALRIVRSDGRRADGEAMKSSGRPSTHNITTPKFRGAGDQESRGTRLEAGPHPRHQRHAGQPDAGAGRSRTPRTSFPSITERIRSIRKWAQRRGHEVQGFHGQVRAGTRIPIRASRPTDIRPRRCSCRSSSSAETT